LRAISDRADEDLPVDFNRFVRADATLNLPRLLLALARSPSRISGLWQLQRHCRQAAERLAAVLVEVVAT
jgi:hypothetical protein